MLFVYASVDHMHAFAERLKNLNDVSKEGILNGKALVYVSPKILAL